MEILIYPFSAVISGCPFSVHSDICDGKRAHTSHTSENKRRMSKERLRGEHVYLFCFLFYSFIIIFFLAYSIDAWGFGWWNSWVDFRLQLENCKCTSRIGMAGLRMHQMDVWRTCLATTSHTTCHTYRHRAHINVHITYRGSESKCHNVEWNRNYCTKMLAT